MLETNLLSDSSDYRSAEDDSTEDNNLHEIETEIEDEIDEGNKEIRDTETPAKEEVVSEDESTKK